MPIGLVLRSQFLGTKLAPKCRPRGACRILRRLPAAKEQGCHKSGSGSQRERVGREEGGGEERLGVRQQGSW